MGNEYMYNRNINGFSGTGFEGFMQRLLSHLGFQVGTFDRKISQGKTVDIVAQKDGRTYYFETKAYRSRHIDINSLKRAIVYTESWQSDNEDTVICLVLLCEISDEQSNFISGQNLPFEIWDINDLFEKCGNNDELINDLTALIPYNVTDLIMDDHGGDTLSVKEKGLNLINRLAESDPGKNGADKKFEGLCADIIKFLFPDELRITEDCIQVKTYDNLFVMDMVCPIKDKKSFWGFIQETFNTKFIVFEFKNYGNKIKQNLIFTTKKYLTRAALKSVAVIISREGFNGGAKAAARGCLREDGKLLLDINIQDLKEMINQKIEGSEPSDYLLERTEDFLIRIGL